MTCTATYPTPATRIQKITLTSVGCRPKWPQASRANGISIEKLAIIRQPTACPSCGSRWREGMIATTNGAMTSTARMTAATAAIASTLTTISFSSRAGGSDRPRRVPAMRP